MDSVTGAKRTLDQLKRKLLVAAYRRKEQEMKELFIGFVGAQLKRGITLGIGILVGAGYLTGLQADAWTSTLVAFASQIVLTVTYKLYDTYAKDWVLKFLSGELPKE